MGYQLKCPATALPQHRRGVALLWLIIALPALLLFLVMVVEIGNLWLARLELEQSLEANALAAVHEWAESGILDTEGPRVIGNNFSIANDVREVAVDLTSASLNPAFDGTLNYLNGAQNENAVFTNIDDPNYVQSGVLIFGAITQLEASTPGGNSVVFDACMEPSCAVGGTVLIDASEQGNLQKAQNNSWGVAFRATDNVDVNANLRIYKIEIDVDPTGNTGYRFQDPPATLSNNDSPYKISAQLDPPSTTFQLDNLFAPHSPIDAADIQFTRTGTTGNVLEITFDTAEAFDGMAPGDRFRFGAQVVENGSGNQVDGDGVGGVTEVRVYFSVGGDAEPVVYGTLFDNADKGGNCNQNASIVQDELGRDHLVVHPTGIMDLPCPPAAAATNNAQSFIQLLGTATPRYHAVRAQASIKVPSVVSSISGFPLGPWEVRAKATAYYDCEVGDPKLIRVDEFLCTP